MASEAAAAAAAAVAAPAPAGCSPHPAGQLQAFLVALQRAMAQAPSQRRVQHAEGKKSSSSASGFMGVTKHRRAGAQLSSHGQNSTVQGFRPAAASQPPLVPPPPPAPPPPQQRLHLAPASPPPCRRTQRYEAHCWVDKKQVYLGEGRPVWAVVALVGGPGLGPATNPAAHSIAPLDCKLSSAPLDRPVPYQARLTRRSRRPARPTCSPCAASAPPTSTLR